MELIKKFLIGKYMEAGDKYKQCDQDSGRELGLVGYAMWKLNTKLAA